MAKFTRLLETPLQRRQALKLIAGTAGALTLAACGVAPEPTPNAKSNLLVLRARVKNLQGRDRERLRAIANFLDPANRSQVDILGEYWAEDGLIIHGKPGGEFINDGIHIVVLAKGESAAAVRAWADQWADVLDIDSDEAATIDLDPMNPDDGDQHFLVFERIEGATTPKAVFGTEPDDVDIASHHTLVNDSGRQMMIVRAPSRGAIYEWVNDWGYHQAIEVLRLSNLSEKLRTCTRSSRTVADTAPLATALAAGPLAAVTPQPQEKIEVADYHPDGLLLTTDQKLGSFYFRHRATGRFLSIDGALRVVSVATPVPADKWTFSRGQIFGQAIGYQLYYNLQHQGTGYYLSGDGTGGVGSGSDPNGRYVGTLSGLTTWQKYKIEVISQFERDQKYLTTDSNGSVYSRVSPDEFADWDQWSDYHYPTEIERTLQDLVTTTKYDAPWPEDGYTGDMKAAYDLIVTILAKSDLGPPKNGGVSDLSIVKADPDYPQSGEPLYAAAQAVYEHLDAEVNHFKALQLWYGDGGHVQTLLTEVTLSNLSVLQSDQILAHQPPPSMTLTYVLSGLITALAIGLAAAVPAPAGPVIGAIIAGAWRTYSTATGGTPKDTLSTTFASLEGDLRRTFNDLISDRENTYSAVGGNWGKLSEFAKLVFDSTLVWPGVTDKVRAVSSRQFEISVWKTVANANWSITGTGTYLYYSDADGVNWARYYLRSPWDYLILVRAKIFDAGDIYDGLLVDHCYLYNAPPGTLAKHLFDDVENGGLGIDITDFYLSRNGWAIPGNLG